MKRSQYWMCFACVVVVYVSVILLTPAQLNHTSRPDGIHYESVVQWNLETMRSPWCFRLLTPVLVRSAAATGWFPDPYMAVTYPLVLAVGILLWLLMRNRGISALTATIMTVLFFFSYPSRKMLHQMSTADPLAMLLLCGGIWAVFEKRYRLFGVITAVGAVNREVAFLLIPIAYINWADTVFDTKAIRKLFWTIPAFLIALTVRMLVPVEGPGFLAFYFNPAYLKECSDAQGGVTGMLYLAYSTFGIFWLIAFLEGIRRPGRTFYLFLSFTLICFSSCFVAHNTSREMMAVFPFLFILTGQFADRSRRLLLPIFLIGLLHSLVKFGAMSSWHPLWILHFRLTWMRGLELVVFLGLLLFTSRTRESE
jgi:hypothetical protein